MRFGGWISVLALLMAVPLCGEAQGADRPAGFSSFSWDHGPQVNWGGNAYPSDLKLTDFNQSIAHITEANTGFTRRAV